MKSLNLVLVLISVTMSCVKGQNPSTLIAETSKNRLLMLCKKWELYKKEFVDPMQRRSPELADSITKEDYKIYDTYIFTQNGRFHHERNIDKEEGVWISDTAITMLGLFTDTINGRYSPDYDNNKNKPGFGCPKFCVRRKIQVLNDTTLNIMFTGFDGALISFYRPVK